MSELYDAEIDGGQGGDTTPTADSLDEACALAIDWADEGDWPAEGCDITIRVWRGEEEESFAHHIPSQAEREDDTLAEDGEVIARSEGEWTTQQIVVMDGEAYYRHANGGAHGAHDQMDGDGVWREQPIEPTRQIDRSEARRLMLDWGYTLADVARKTRAITAD